jgi:hypothetical protein
MTVRLVPAPQLPPPDDRLVWRLLKGERCAQAVLRVLDFGLELRISVDEDLRWSQVVRDGTLDALASEKRRALEERDGMPLNSVELRSRLATEKRPASTEAERLLPAAHWPECAASLAGRTRMPRSPG